VSAIRQEILDLASDDYVGLWEVLWVIQRHFPEDTPVSVREKAQQLLLDLLRERLLQLYEGARFDGDEKMIARDDQNDLLNVGTYWNEPLGEIKHLRVVATEQGENAYLAGDL
jgi:hypothetical protein